MAQSATQATFMFDLAVQVPADMFALRPTRVVLLFCCICLVAMATQMDHSHDAKDQLKALRKHTDLPIVPLCALDGRCVPPHPTPHHTTSDYHLVPYHAMSYTCGRLVCACTQICECEL